MLEHRFSGTPFTIGIEEELMLLDPESFDLVQGIERILPLVPEVRKEQVKHELFQSVLEIATVPHPSVAAACAELAELRGLVAGLARERGMRVGAAATHPFARCEDQLVVERERYRELIADLGFIARRELIFGTHVHVAIDDPDKAIYVADGIRRYLPLLLALSTNSPFWEGTDTGMMSARIPVFRAFPRVGVPPHYGSWEVFAGRVDQMMRAGAIEDYTYLWWDVRPHPNLGTVETRIFDQASRLEDTAAFAAMTHCLAFRFSMMFDDGEPMIEQPWELIDDNKVRAALRGMEGQLVDFSLGRHVAAGELASRLLMELGPCAEELGCATELSRIATIAAEGTGARRQLEAAAANGGDLRALIAELIVLEG